MLHYGADHLDCFLEGSAEGSCLPAAGVAFYADSITVDSQSGEADSIVILRWLASASYQMIAVDSNVHAGGDWVGLEKQCQLGLSGAHRLVHGSAYQGQAPVRPPEGVSFVAVPLRDELL